VIKRCGLRTVEILQVKNRVTLHFGEKKAFFNAIAVEVNEPWYRLANDCVEIVVGYVSVFPFEPVFFRAVRLHAIGDLEAERVGHDFGGHIEFLDQDLNLAPIQNFEIYYNIHIV